MTVIEGLRTMLSARRTDAESIITTAVQAAADGETFDVEQLLAALTTKAQTLADFESLVETELSRRAAVAQLAEADELRTEVDAARKLADKARQRVVKAEAAVKEARLEYETVFSEYRGLSRTEDALRFRANQRLETITPAN